MNAFKLSPNDQSFPHNQCSFVFTSKCSTLKRTVTKNYGLSETPGAFWLTENILRTVVIGANQLIFSIIWSLCMCALWNSKLTWHFYLIFRDFHAFRARKKTSALEQIYCFTQANIYLTKVSLKQKRNISVYINFSWWPGCTRHTHVHAHALLKLRKPIYSQNIKEEAFSFASFPKYTWQVRGTIPAQTTGRFGPGNINDYLK